MKIHYGLPGSRTACGRRLHNVSNTPSKVTCAACRATLQFITRHFTRSAVTDTELAALTRTERKRS